jgi:glycerophosphoryl diester phosphodiesterase
MLTDLDRPLNIAHRGASKIAPENTLAAFEKADEVGADGIEFDVHLSADGVPVVIHDATVDATTGSSGRVRDMTVSQLKRLDAGSTFDPAFAGERIPTLAETLETFGERLLLNIELKEMSVFDRGLEQTVVDLVEEYGLQDRVFFSSFNPFALRRAQDLAPRIPTGLCYIYARRPFLHLASLIMTRRNAAFHPYHPIADEQHIGWARAHDKRVNVWTVDDPADMRRFIRWRVNGIITNVPSILRQVLEEENPGGTSDTPAGLGRRDGHGV